MIDSQKIKNFHKGFTLIEMLVTIFVLGVGLIGALSFFNININNQFEAKNELIAAGLAQEGTDLVRNIKDYNQLNPPNAWDFNLSGCGAIDFNSLSNHKCSTAGTAVCINANLRYYQCASGAAGDTGFTRKIAIDTSHKAADGYIIVTCTVTWSNNSRTTTAKDILYNNSY